MNKIDYNNLAFYSALGFKSGIEIHQQIFTQKKLFCHCPAGRYSKVHDAEVLRAVARHLAALDRAPMFAEALHRLAPLEREVGRRIPRTDVDAILGLPARLEAVARASRTA